MSDERWLPAPGYEGRYEVSDWGRVSRPPKIVQGEEWPRDFKDEVMLTGSGTRVLAVSLWKHGRRHFVPLHALVACAFLGPCPHGMEAVHGTKGPLDNSVANLSYGTPRSWNSFRGERWLPAPGYEGRFDVSDQGRVRGVIRIVPGLRLPGKIKVLIVVVGSGWCEVGVRLRPWRWRYKPVDLLVTHAFLGPRPDGMVIEHGVEGPLVDSVANLSYVAPGVGVYYPRFGFLVRPSALPGDPVALNPCHLRKSALQLGGH